MNVSEDQCPTSQFSLPLAENEAKKTKWGGDRYITLEDRIPVEERYPAPVQTGLGAHPASCTMGTGSLPGVKRPGRGVDHPPPSSAQVKERVDIYIHYTVNVIAFLVLYLWAVLSAFRKNFLLP